MSRETHQPIDILLVEDNEADADLTRIVLDRSELPYRLHVVHDGVEALAFLWRDGEFRDAPRPSLVLLDWNLPKKHGSEVLQEIKADPRLWSIPVIVLSTSRAPDDITRSYQQRANCYLSKPVGLDEFTATMRCLESFWFKLAELPQDQDSLSR